MRAIALALVLASATTACGALIGVDYTLAQDDAPDANGRGDASAPGFDGAIVVDDGGAPKDAASAHDAARDAAPDALTCAAGEGGAVACGGKECASVCCVGGNGPTCDPGDGAACLIDPSGVFECDELADCARDKKVCCAGAFAGFVRAACANSCAAPSAELCRTSCDCDPGVACVPCDAGAQSFSACGRCPTK